MENTRTCLKCGASIAHRGAKAKYCSDKCRQELVRPELGMKKLFIQDRDGFRCIYCNKSSIGSDELFSIDHIVPKCRGGSDSIYNLAYCCRSCNSQKNQYTLQENSLKDILDQIKKRSDKKLADRTEECLTMAKSQSYYKRLYSSPNSNVKIFEEMQNQKVIKGIEIVYYELKNHRKALFCINMDGGVYQHVPSDFLCKILDIKLN